jgi:hypothetical protein
MARRSRAGVMFGVPGAIVSSRIDTDSYVWLTWGWNNTALFQFDKKDYIPVLLALESKSGKAPD